MKFLKKVATDAEVVTQEEYDVVYYSEESKGITVLGGEIPDDPYQYYITYNVTSTTQPTTLFFEFGAQSYITAMSIDGGEDVTPSTSTTFTTTGEHVVAYKVDETIETVAPLFGNGSGNPAIISVKIGKGLKHITWLGFQGDANLSSVTVGNVTYTNTNDIYQALAKNGTGAQMVFTGTKLTQDYVAPTIASGDYIDMKLPSNTKWASCNLGATTPTEYGKYYQWGATVGYYQNEQGAKTNSYWSTAPFNNGSSSYNASYFTANSGTWLTETAELKPAYDAVYQETNGQAHMPTKEQYMELLFNSVGEFTSVDGVNGVVLTSIKDASKTLFVPASGYFLNGSSYGIGSSGCVWSSSLNASNPNLSWYLFFLSGSMYLFNNGRFNGRSVRGVWGQN